MLMSLQKIETEETRRQTYDSNLVLLEFIVNYSFEMRQEDSTELESPSLQQLIEQTNNCSSIQDNEESRILQETQDLLQSLHNQYPIPSRPLVSDFQSKGLVSLNLHGRGLGAIEVSLSLHLCLASEDCQWHRIGPFSIRKSTKSDPNLQSNDNFRRNWISPKT